MSTKSPQVAWLDIVSELMMNKNLIDRDVRLYRVLINRPMIAMEGSVKVGFQDGF